MKEKDSSHKIFIREFAKLIGMKRLKINCEALDKLLGGGIEYQTITEVYGESGSGKTNFCLQASREVANIGKKVIFVDSEGVSIERLQQICSEYNFEKIVSNICFFTPDSLSDQEKIIGSINKINNLGLIVVDTFNMFYRYEFDRDEKRADRSLNRQLTDLQLMARKKDIPVIISSQVYTAESGEIKPFAGRCIEHFAKTIIRFDVVGKGVRQATIIKHRSIPEGEKAIFKITGKGLE